MGLASQGERASRGVLPTKPPSILVRQMSLIRVPVPKLEQREGISQFIPGASAEEGAQSRGDPQPWLPHNAKGKEPARLLGSAESRHSAYLGEKGTVSAKSLITNITPVKF